MSKDLTPIKRKNLLDAVVVGAVYGAGSTNESKDYAKNIGFGIGGNMTGDRLYNRIGGAYGNPIKRKSVPELTGVASKSTYEKIMERNKK